MLLADIREGMILSRPRHRNFIYRAIDELIIVSEPRITSAANQYLVRTLHHKDSYMRAEELCIQEDGHMLLAPRLTHKLAWLNHSKIVMWSDSKGVLLKLRLTESRSLVSC